MTLSQKYHQLASKDCRGFALPTVMLVSLLMLSVLVVSVSAATTMRSALNEQYYKKLAIQAAESGLARAEACLKNNDYTPQWGGSSTRLTPESACSGSGTSCNTSQCYILNSGNMRSYFRVGAPVDEGGTQLVSSVGTIEILRSSDGSVWRRYTHIAMARMGAVVSFNDVIFGYSNESGAYFATISSDGRIQGVGGNTYGALGNGTTDPTLTPKDYILPDDAQPVSVHTNFLSQGWNMYAVTTDGRVFGAGYNGYGQLGDGTFTSRRIPVQFNLPAGKEARHVGVLGRATYVMTTDNNVYSAGECSEGMLGNNYTIDGCTNRSTPARVALPTPSSTDANTRPTNNISLDRTTAYLLMEGGRVYGWGNNDNGMLSTGNTTRTSTPIKIGTYGDSGQPKATQIVFDGRTVYILDNNGVVQTAGWNDYGQLGGAPSPLVLQANGHCLDGNQATVGATVTLWSCGGQAWQNWALYPDGTIRNVTNNTCLDAYTGGANGAEVRTNSCTASTNQRWTINQDRTIRSQASGRCLDANGQQLGSNGAKITTYNCTNVPNQKWNLGDARRLGKITLPDATAKVTKMATDQYSAVFLTDKGDVWGVGLNDHGQIGTGTTATINPIPKKFILPTGVSAVDIYNTARNSSEEQSNTYVIGSDGNVYGAGDNNFGQLGDGTTIDRSTPVRMLLPTGVSASAVQAGYGTAVILAEGGIIYTVGNNSHGQLGDGTTTNSTIPKANRYTNIVPITQF